MPSLRELRSALGAFANDKNDEELLQLAATTMGVSPGRIASEYGYKPTASGIAGLRTGAAIDQYQAGLYGLGEAVTGADFFRRGRQANEFESNVALERARAQGAIGSFEEVQGLSDIPSYLGGLAIGSAPYAIEALGGGLAARGLMTGTRAALGAATAGGDAAAAAQATRALRAGQTAGGVVAAYPSAVGGILQAQREQAGEADLSSAAALGVPFAALNALGIEGALARQQMLRSGIGALDNLQGIRGGLARAGASGVRTGLTESGTETLQEMATQFGRMAVDSDEAFLSDAALGRYKESAIGGAFLGGAAGGLTGFGRSEQYRPPVQERDLTLTADQAPPADTGKIIELPNGRIINTGAAAPADVGLKKFVDETTGVIRPSRKGYEDQFKAAFNEPSGQYTSDPTTGIERELTVGEVFQRNAGLMDLTQDKPAETAAAASTAAKVATVRDPKDIFIRDTLKVIPQKYMGKGRYEKAVQLMDEAIINARKGAPSGIPTSTGLGTAGGVGVGGAVVPGAVGTAGSAPSIQGAVGGTAAGTGAPLQQAGILPDTSGQPSTTVTTAPTDLTTPPASTSKFRRAPKPMTVLEAAEAAKAQQTGTRKQATLARGEVTPDVVSKLSDDQLATELTNVNISDAEYALLQQEQARRSQKDAVDERQVVLRQIFGDRNGDIIFDVVGMGMSEPEAAAKYNTSRQNIQKIAGATGQKTWPERILRAKTKFGLTDAQIADAFNTTAPDSLESQVQTDVFGQSQERMDEGEAIEAGLENIVKTAGASTAAVEGFTDLQNEIDATLEALAAETDEAVLKELNEKLAEQLVKVRAVEKRAQAEVRANAGRKSKKDEADEAVAETVKPVGEPDAVQVQSTAVVPVQPKTEAGKGVGGQVRRTEKPASKGQVTVQGQAKEQVNKGQVLWNNLVAKTPGLVPYEQLTKLEQDYLTDLAVRTNGKPVVAKEMGLQQLLTKEPITIEGETRIIDEQVTTQVAALPAPQVERLEQHYGAKRGSAEFLEKVQADITKYVTQGAEAVAGAIRSIIKAMAEGVLAMGIVFNPNITKDAFTLNVAKTFEQTIEVTQAVPAVAKAQMSPTAQAVYEAMAPVAMKSGKWFMVADKPNGMLHIFKEDGSHALSDPTLYGKDTGDVMEAVSSLKGGAKITPAGKFTLKARASTYAGGQELILVESKDYTGYIAIHAADTSDASENRLGRLDTPSAADNRVSYGCINTKHDTFINEIAPNIANLDGGMVFVVPDAQEQAAQMFAAETRTETRTEDGQGAKGVAAASVVGKEENMLFGKDLPTVQAPKLVNNGRTLDLVIDGKVTKTYDLVSQGLWDAYKGRPEAQENMLQNQGPRQIRSEAIEALKDAQRVYSEQAPLSRVENDAIQALANNDTSLMKRIVTNLTIRDSVLRMLSSALSFPGQPYKGFSDLAAMSKEDPRARLTAENILRYAPEYMLKNANIPAEFKDIQFGKDRVANQPYTAVGLTAEIKNFIRADITDRKLVIVDSIDDLLNSGTPEVRALGEAIQAKGAYGVAQGGVAYLIANRIQQGQGRAKFMHEVGAHLGLENLLPTAVYDRLVDQIATWAGSNRDSLEAQLAAKAKARVGYAKTPTADEREELLAYFIEEAMLAGVDPTAADKESGPLMAWFRTLWAAFKIAVRKLGFKPENLKAQDVVNLAFGAARLEMNGSWHGTAATFRRFNHEFMSSGEGAQAYGWGSYIAQAVGIGKGYWWNDVKRKETSTVENTLKQYVGWRFAESVLHPVDREEIAYAGSQIKVAKDLAEAVYMNPAEFATPGYLARRFLEAGLDYIKLVSPTGEKKTVRIGGPAGNLMRVDMAVSNDEMINWDSPFAYQPEIVRDFVKGEAATIKDLNDNKGANIRIKTGEDIYKYLVARFWNESKGTGSWKDASPEVRMAVKEKASKYLESKGIQGIRYLDAESRENTLDNISFTKDGKTIKSRAGILQAYFTPGAIVQGYGGPDKVIRFDPAKELITVIAVDNDGNPRRGERERTHFTIPSVKDVSFAMKERGYITSTTNRTRNFVIFNEKNIQRVGSEIAADKERMKFGVNAPNQGTIQRNIAKLPKASQSPVRNIVRALGDLGGAGLDYVVFTSDLIKRAVDAGLTSAQTFADALAQRRARVSEFEREIERIADGYADIEPEFKGAGRGSVNDFLFESTRTLKWGYDSGKIKADPEMAIAFNKLGPKAQKFVKNVFAHGDKILSQKKQSVLKSANSEYDAMIQAAQNMVNTATDAKEKQKAEGELAALKAEKVATLKRFQTLFAIREGKPYAPIKRDGAYVVIGKSAEYKAAEAAKDRKRIKQLESDPDHYHVSFVDTKWAARTLSDNLAEQGVFEDADIVKRSEAFEEAFSGEALLPALTKIRAAVDKRDDSDRSKMLNIVSQLYLEALAEGSARKSEMRRRGVAGEVDMLQAFTRQGRADANFLANVEFEPLIQDALQQMRNDRRGGNRERKSEIFDELTKRYVDSLETKGNGFITGLTNTASKYFLASSPAYYMQNLTQPFMMSLPALAGRHDYTKAGKALFDAYAELGPLFKDIKLFDQQFDFSKVPADVRAAITKLVNQGQIDIGLATEINEYKVDADSKLGKFAQRLNKSMRLAVQKVEATNRLSTAIAAYRLEFARTKDTEKATQYAADILTDTHGDYTAMNAPRIFNSQWGKVALQFRKFQLIQIAFYAKLLRDAFTNPAERAVAMRTLAFSLGHTAVFAGMMGLPGYAAIAAILGFFGDEDEPYDLTADMRQALGPEWADLIMRGAPTLVGVDLSGKIGAGNMLSIMPFSDADLSTTAGRAEAFGTLVGGASLGMVSRVADGMGLILSGDYYKGVERTMPKGVSDALKAGRQAAEGMTRRNGDVVLPADEVSAISAVLTGLGVPSVKETVVYERQNRMRDVTQNFQDRTTRIKNDYAKAVRENDGEGKQDAREAWQKLQRTRQENGLKPQPLSNLLKAPQEQREREKQTIGGVTYRQGQRKLAESVAEN